LRTACRSQPYEPRRISPTPRPSLRRCASGDADRILPADAASRRQAKLIKNVKFVELAGGPHGVLWTHAEQINTELTKFLGWWLWPTTNFAFFEARQRKKKPRTQCLPAAPAM
jgi:hypothetical protein